jgi:hypothetical protein
MNELEESKFCIDVRYSVRKLLLLLVDKYVTLFNHTLLAYVP